MYISNIMRFKSLLNEAKFNQLKLKKQVLF